MFRNRNRSLGFRLEDGLQVLARAKVDLYPTRGSFQLIVEHMEESGEGALRRAFDALKTRLSREGLFDAEQKANCRRFQSESASLLPPPARPCETF